MLEVKLNGQRKIIPNKWEELTTDKLIRIDAHDKKDLLGLFSILTEMDLEILESDKTPGMEKALYKAVEFIFNPPDWTKLKPSKSLYYMGGLYEIPTDFSKMMLGQKILISQLVVQEEKLVENIAKVVSIAMQPIIDKSEKYDEKRAENIEKNLLKHNGLEVYAQAKFFFQLSVNL